MKFVTLLCAIINLKRENVNLMMTHLYPLNLPTKEVVKFEEIPTNEVELEVLQRGNNAREKMVCRDAIRFLLTSEFFSSLIYGRDTNK